MLNDFLINYGAPIAVSLTLAVGGMAVKNGRDIAIQQTENKNLIVIQQELVKEVKILNKAVTRIETKLED